MQRPCLTLLLLLAFSALVLAQDKHECKVIWMDNEMLQKSVRKSADDQTAESVGKKLPEGFTILGNFKTKIAEEEWTTKSFRVPKLNQFVTASVYYTDELMTVDVPNGKTLQDSVLIAIAIGDKEYPNAVHAPLRAVAEVNINDTVNTFRISTKAVLSGKPYVAYMECKW